MRHCSNVSCGLTFPLDAPERCPNCGAPTVQATKAGVQPASFTPSASPSVHSPTIRFKWLAVVAAIFLVAVTAIILIARSRPQQSKDPGGADSQEVAASVQPQQPSASPAATAPAPSPSPPSPAQRPAAPPSPPQPSFRSAAYDYIQANARRIMLKAHPLTKGEVTAIEDAGQESERAFSYRLHYRDDAFSSASHSMLVTVHMNGRGQFDRYEIPPGGDTGPVPPGFAANAAAEALNYLLNNNSR